MRFSSFLTFVAGLGVAAGSVYMARDYIENEYAKRQAVEEEKVVNVIVAAQDIEFGHVVDAQKLTTIAWPKEALPSGVFTAYDTLLPNENREFRRAKRAIAQGELILANKVSNFGEKVTIVQTISPNNRAMAINVNAQTGVGGFVTPGDFVDILLTHGSNKELKTVTILQNKRIIGVDQEADEQKDTPGVARTVTVEVTPEEGQRLALAQRAGTLSLTLRTLEAANDEPLESIGLSDVLRELSPVPEQAPVKTVVVRRGTDVTVTELR